MIDTHSTVQITLLYSVVSSPDPFLPRLSGHIAGADTDPTGKPVVGLGGTAYHTSLPPRVGVRRAGIRSGFQT